MPTVQKLRDFYKIYRDEQELGIEEVSVVSTMERIMCNLTFMHIR